MHIPRLPASDSLGIADSHTSRALPWRPDEGTLRLPIVPGKHPGYNPWDTLFRLAFISPARHLPYRRHSCCAGKFTPLPTNQSALVKKIARACWPRAFSSRRYRQSFCYATQAKQVFFATHQQRPPGQGGCRHQHFIEFDAADHLGLVIEHHLKNLTFFRCA